MANAALLPGMQFFGTDFAGYKVYSYDAGGTSTAKALYTSSSGSSGSSYAQGFALDANGSTTAGIWGTGFYRILIKTSDGLTTVIDWDNVSGADATSSSSSSSSATALDPSQNLLRNTCLRLWSNDTTTRSAIADGAVTANDWYVLTQSGNADASRLSTAAHSLTNFAGRVTNVHASAQRMAHISFSDSYVVEDIIGDTATISCAVRTDVGMAVRMALFAVQSASSVTVDIVNNWASPTFTEGNFFVSSANLEIINTTSQTTVANEWKTITTSGTVPNNATFLGLIVWTDSTVGVNGTFDITAAMCYEGNSTLEWRKESLALARAINIGARSTTIDKDTSVDLGEKLTIDFGTPSAAKTLNFTPVMCRAYHNTTQSINSGADRQVSFNTESFDIGSNFATNAFTAPTDGIYQVLANVNYADPGGNRGQSLAIYVNGVKYSETSDNHTDFGTARQGISIADMVALTAGQTVTIFTSSSSNETLEATNSWVSIALVHPLRATSF